MPPRKSPPQCSNILKAKISKMALTRTPDPIRPTMPGTDPNRPRDVTFGGFCLGGKYPGGFLQVVNSGYHKTGIKSRTVLEEDFRGGGSVTPSFLFISTGIRYTTVANAAPVS